MGPAWLVPIVVSILVTLWKVPVIWRSSNKEGHLLDLFSYVGVAFLLYGLLFWLGVEISELMGGVIYEPIVHVGAIVVFLVCYIFVLTATERGTKKAGPEEIETLVRGMDRMFDLIKRTNRSYGKLNERVKRVETDVANKMGEAAERIDEAVEKQKTESEALGENVTTKMKEFEKTAGYVAKEHRKDSAEIRELLEEWGEEMGKVAENQRKNIEVLREEVKTFRGAVAEVRGHKWEDVIADRIKKLGFEVEVGRPKGQPDIVVKGSKGNVIGVVGCKSYALKSRRGMSDKFKPEVKLAREKEVPLAIAIQNRLNNLEFFKIYKLGELKNFKCSAPTWLAGEGASEQDRDEQAKCRREFKGFIAKIS